MEKRTISSLIIFTVIILITVLTTCLFEMERSNDHNSVNDNNGVVDDNNNGVNDWDWREATSSANWSARFSHTSVVFDNKIWVIGGSISDHGEICKNDVWYSSDGVNWIEATASANWSGRENHTSVVFNDNIWVIGGSHDGNRKNDVWYSSDGVNWTESTASADWSARGSHTSVIFNDKIWVIGGSDGSYKNDVWYYGTN